MRIVQIGPYPINENLIQGGVEASVYGLSHEQSKASDVFILDIPRLGIEDKTEVTERTTIFRFHNPGPHIRDASKRVQDILQIIKEIKPDVCHLHGTGKFSWAMIKAIRSLSIPIALTVHGLIHVEKKNALTHHFSLKKAYQFVTQSLYERKILSSLKTVIVDTEYVARAINNYRLRRTPAMIVIPQGISQDFFQTKCSSESNSILSVGSISRRKGHLLLIQAFSIAAAKLKEIQLTICGVLADEAYFSELKNYISTLSCRDRISLRANISKEELIQLYQNAHIFALHSQEESQGIVFAEAMATGLPIIATRVGGIPDIVTDGMTGFLSDFGNVNSFSDAILRVFNKDFRWAEMSTNCIETASMYSWQRISQHIETVYSTL